MAELVVVGLLGGVGSGKSTVARLFRERGAFVLDADALAHQALSRPDVKESIARAFGANAIGADGEVDRRCLADVVFADEGRRRTLESIVHPPVLLAIERELDRLTAEPGPPCVVVLDVPLLLESPLDARCDARVFVDTPLDVREERVRATRGWSPEELARREKNQVPIERKRAAAEYRMDNADSLESVRARVGAIHEELLSKSSARRPRGGSVSRPSPPTTEG